MAFSAEGQKTDGHRNGCNIHCWITRVLAGGIAPTPPCADLPESLPKVVNGNQTSRNDGISHATGDQCTDQASPGWCFGLVALRHHDFH